MKDHMHNEYMAQTFPQPPKVQNTAFYEDFFLASTFLFQSLETHKLYAFSLLCY